MENNFYSIDWEEQWRLHGAGYKDGFVHVKAGERVIKLRPGPGFGDLSHPTTTMMLELMAGKVAGRHVVDIGSGSGVLTLAAAAMGAASAVGVDIDPAAVEHARQNALINDLPAVFYLPEQFLSVPEYCCVLMNMITSEQEAAWPHYPFVWKNAADMIVSGVLAEQKASYLKSMEKKGWHLVREIKKKGWRAFDLSKKLGIRT